MRWCLAPGAGIKFHYGDLLVAAQRNIKGFKREDIVTDDITKRFTREHFSETKKERAVTFKQAAKLVCAWFSDPSEAVEQIILFRNLLRTIRSKTKGDYNGTDDEDHIFVHEENEAVTKKAYNELTKEQIGVIAKNAGMVSEFVEKHHKKRAATATGVAAISTEEEHDSAGENEIEANEAMESIAGAPETAHNEGHMNASGGLDIVDIHKGGLEKSSIGAVGGNKLVHQKVKQIDSLQILVDGVPQSFRRVEVPGRGAMLLTNDIIVKINKNTQKSAGDYFRDLSQEKKNEVCVSCL